MTDTGNLKPWQPGQSGNPAGRAKGSRNKLSDAFLEDLLAAWEANGKTAIEAVIKDRPQDFLKVVASILPKEIVAEATHRYVALLPEQPETVEQWQQRHSPRPVQ